MDARWVWRGIAALAVGAILFALPGVVAQPAAQKGGGGLTGAGAPPEGMQADTARQMTPFEQFADKLKLDEKTQVPAAREIFMGGVTAAGPVGVELLQLRQKLLNVALGGTAEDLKQTQDAYAATAAKMAGIEATTFAKVFALLKPNQQSNAPQAFAVMTGIFQPAGAIRGGGRGGR